MNKEVWYILDIGPLIHPDIEEILVLLEDLLYLGRGKDNRKLGLVFGVVIDVEEFHSQLKGGEGLVIQ